MTSEAPPVPLAIVGGGAAAAWLLILLRRKLGRLPETVVVEPRAAIGLGVAYSTTRDAHRLNVTAEKMDMHPAEGVMSFVDWLSQFSDHSARNYVPRLLYGRYLRDVLAEELGTDRVVHRQAMAQSLTRDGQYYRLALSDGSSVLAERVVLAVGNPPSRRLWQGRSDRVVENPLSESGEWPRAAKRVLIAGAGLSAIDIMLQLEAQEADRHYTVVAPHPFFPPYDIEVQPTEFDLDGFPGPADLWNWAKSHRSAGPAPHCWYPPTDGLRPHAGAIWVSWSPLQRSIFLRHAMRHWLHLRHRAAPEAAEVIDRLAAGGRLNLVKGRARVTGADDGGVDLAIGDQQMRFDLVANTTGPDLNPGNNPLLSSLIDQGLAKADPHGLGIQVTSEGSVVTQHGPTDSLLALGVWTRGSLWEVVAVPHLREAARRLMPRLSAGFPSQFQLVGPVSRLARR